MVKRKDIEAATKKCLVKAGTTFRRDQIDAYHRAILTEKNPNAKWVLEKILENAEVAKKRKLPLCDDTGIPHVFIEIGQAVRLPAAWLPAIHSGILQGLKTLPGRPMAVRGNDTKRIDQSAGLFIDPEKVVPAPVVIKPASGNRLKITVLMLGGGPEIRAKTFRIFHKRNTESVFREAAGWLASEVVHLGCTPCIPAIGIGRTHVEASALMLEAMKNGSLNRQNRWEKFVTEEINRVNVGPLGLGGSTTALGSVINVGPLRASGVRIVSVRPCCCVEPRRATVVIN